MGNFFLLNPDFFFWRQRASTKGSARIFLGGGFYNLFFFPTFFLIQKVGAK
jgi:hypothetical protein